MRWARSVDQRLGPRASIRNHSRPGYRGEGGPGAVATSGAADLVDGVTQTVIGRCSGGDEVFETACDVEEPLWREREPCERRVDDVAGAVGAVEPVLQELVAAEAHRGCDSDFIDFENLTAPVAPWTAWHTNRAQGPIEYDLAWVPTEVSDRYPGVDREILNECRGFVLALVAAHRWRRDDQHPSGRPSGVAFLDVLRAGPPWPALDDVSW